MLPPHNIEIDVFPVPPTFCDFHSSYYELKSCVPPRSPIGVSGAEEPDIVRWKRITSHTSTGLLGEAPGGVRRVFSGAGINVEHEKKVDLGVLRGAECHGKVPVPPFSTVDRVCVKRVSNLR